MKAEDTSLAIADGVCCWRVEKSKINKAYKDAKTQIRDGKEYSLKYDPHK